MKIQNLILKSQGSLYFSMYMHEYHIVKWAKYHKKILISYIVILDYILGILLLDLTTWNRLLTNETTETQSDYRYKSL